MATVAVLAAALTSPQALAQGWTLLPLPQEASFVRAVDVDPAIPSVLHVGAVAQFGIVTRTFGGLFRSTDGGASWSAALAQAQTVSIARAPSSPIRLYAATGSGVLKSTDAGATWVSTASLPVSCCSSVAVAPDGTVYAGDSDNVFRSRDGGANWSPSSVLAGFSITQVVVDPRTPSNVYAASYYRGPVVLGGWGAIFKSTDAGQTWSVLRQGFPFGAIAVDPLTPTTVYTSSGGVPFKSTDGGASWTEKRFGLLYGVTALLVDPVQTRTVYAGTFGAGVYRSTDGGETWLPFGSGMGPQTVFSLAIDSTPQHNLYAGGDGLFRISAVAVADSCAPDLTTLCLQQSRFRVAVAWRNSANSSGFGQALPITANTGAFWFFDPANLELVVKVLDGRSVNGRFWMFYGALSNVEYAIAVTDTLTGAVKTYFNPQGQFASVADTSAF